CAIRRRERSGRRRKCACYSWFMTEDNACGKDLSWREVDCELRTIAKQRRALDASEAYWLCEAERLEIWRELGHVSLLEYLEQVFGYTPHVALERMRVARVIDVMPELGEALEHGELSHSAVRELSRVTVPRTVDAWLDAARGKTVREIEELVATHEAGDQPDDPPKPHLRPRMVTMELQPEVFAAYRHSTAVLSDDVVISSTITSSSGRCA